MIGGPIEGAVTPALSDRVRAELDESGADVVVCHVAAVVEPDIGTVDELARARLAALRRGCELRLTDATERLRELLDLAGLAETVPCEGEDEEAASGLEARRQAEGGEEALGVEEERDPADPTA